LQQVFHRTGHTVSFAFLDFFRGHGGLRTFGYPISEMLLEDGYTVQYFERARMEWHPEVLRGPQIRLSKVGETYLARYPVAPDARAPLPPPPGLTESDGGATEIAVSELRVAAAVGSPLAPRSGSQTVHAFVTNQLGLPVEGASGAVEVQYGHQVASYLLPPTDSAGHSELTFELGESEPGRHVVIDVVAAYGDVMGETDTFFLAWW
jgi:hypothetical protein